MKRCWRADRKFCGAAEEQNRMKLFPFLRQRVGDGGGGGKLSLNPGLPAAAICIFSDAPLAVPGNIRPVGFRYRQIGRYLHRFRRISPYGGGLITIWQHAVCPAYVFMLQFQSVSGEGGGKKIKKITQPSELGHLHHAEQILIQRFGSLLHIRRCPNGAVKKRRTV